MFTGLELRADIAQCSRDVRLVQKGESCARTRSLTEEMKSYTSHAKIVQLYQSRTNRSSAAASAFLSLHFLFQDLTQYQECYWPNTGPNSQPLCVGFLQSRS